MEVSRGGFPELFSACPGGKRRRRRRWRRRRGSNLVGKARRDAAFYPREGFMGIASSDVIRR